MSFNIINPINGSVVMTIERGQHYDLPASKTFHVMPSCIALITHQIRIKCDGPVIITAIPGVLVGLAAWVLTSHVLDGSITTEVINFADTRLLLRQGDSVSRLVAL